MVARGTFVLHSFLEPPVKAGSYQLHGTQPITELPIAEHVSEVTVSAPRFVMPPDQILSTFPPAMAEGDFGSRLPQIALKRRTLPWERDPGGPARQANDPPRPWLALVVIAEGEGALSPEPVPVAQCVTPGVTIPHPEEADSPTGYFLTVTQTVVDKVFPTVEDLPLLVHVREVDVADTELANGDDDGWLAVVLANRLPIAVPHPDPATGTVVSAPVKYIACLVNLEGQVDALPTDADLETDDELVLTAAVQDLSLLAAATRSADQVVMGTGHPYALAKRAAVSDGGALSVQAATPAPHLASGTWATAASATGATRLTPDDGGVAVRKEMAGGFARDYGLFLLEKTYRFPVLAHWSFTGTNEGDFRSLAQGLDVGLLGTEVGTVWGIDPVGSPTTKVEHLNAPRPGDPPRPDPAEVAETGHVGLPQTTRRGEAARAWYRGPFVPLPTDRDPADAEMPHVSDQLRTLTPEGREDVSLAAAFEIGRLLGLSQPALVRALVQGGADQFGAARAGELGSRLTEKAFPIDSSRLAGDLGRLVGLQLATLAGASPGNAATVVGPGRPVADPGRSIELKGSLDTVVAAGLGLDLDAVVKAADAVGLPAALAGTEVAVGRSDGAFDPGALDGLRARLDTELTRVAAAAVPTTRPVRAPKGGRRRTADAAPEVVPDALDELLGTAHVEGEAPR
jgi:hypothetical protein